MFKEPQQLPLADECASGGYFFSNRVECEGPDEIQTLQAETEGGDPFGSIAAIGAMTDT